MHVLIKETTHVYTPQLPLLLQQRCNRIGHAPLNKTSGYEVRRLVDVAHSAAIVDVLADSFVAKEPLHVLLGVTRCEMMQFARSLYAEAAKGDLSLVVLERDGGRIVGGDFLFDYFAGVSVQVGVCGWVCVRVRACVRACVCLRACVRACASD